MKEIEIPNLTLSYLVLENRTFIENSFVNKIQEMENGWLKFKLNKQNFGSKDLIVSPRIFFFTKYSIPAKQMTSGFGAFLRKQLDNRKIIAVKQHGFDRVVEMEFQDFYLIFEFFAKGNIILADKEYRILAVLRKEEWKDRTLKKGETYKFPSSKGKSPDKVSLQELQEIFKGEQSTVVSLIKGMNISPVFAEEICAKAKIPKEEKASSLAKVQVEKIHLLMQKFYTDLSKESIKPFIAESGETQILLPFCLEAQKEGKIKESLNDCLDELLAKKPLEKPEEKESGAIASKRIRELEHSLELQKNSIAGFEKEAIELQKKGETIFNHYVDLKNLVEAISRGKSQNFSEKEIFDKVKRVFPKIKSVSLADSKIVVEVD